jgi:hypothetical protein
MVLRRVHEAGDGPPNDPHDVSKLKLSTGAHWTFLADTDLEVQSTLDIREYTDTHHDANVPHALVLAPGLNLGELLRRIKPDFDPTTAKAKAAWKRANGKVAVGHR